MRWRRWLIVVSAALALWALLIVLTGGISVRYDPIAFSSRNPRNPLILALLFAIAGWAGAPAGRRSATAAADWAWLATRARVIATRVWQGAGRIETRLIEHTPSRLAPVLAGIVAVAIVILGFREGAFAAAGADAWGYVSEAERWASGSLRLEQPLMRELSAQIPRHALAPLAYVPARDRMEVVPVVAPGLPMLMALFAIVGGREAVFYVLPLLAGLAIAGTYLITARIGGRWAGVVAAVLMASSPAFLFQLTAAPMSDIPVATWWALSLAALLAPSRRMALLSGLAAGAAMLTRPNLAPLAAIACAIPLWQARIEGSLLGVGIQRLLLFVAGTVPAVIAIAMVNTVWYGSPLASGYGSFGELYQWANIGPNLTLYPRWLLESQSPLIFLAAVGVLVVKRRAAAVMLAAFCLGVLACYLAYMPFGVWWYLRFLLPGYAPLLALTAVGLAYAAGRLPRGLRIAAATVVLALTVRSTIAFATARATFQTEGEMKYAIAGRYVADHLPPRAVLFTMQHSGSVRYYSGRITVRWDLVPSDKVEWTIGEIQRLGYAPYALIEDWEEELWRQQAGPERIAAVLGTPLITLPLGNVRIYDLRQTARLLH